jgi:hypothetical protein
VGNYVIATPSNLGNFMIADTRRPRLLDVDAVAALFAGGRAAAC